MMKKINFKLLTNCSFENVINDTSSEHDALSSSEYPKKMIAYIRGDYNYQWWTSFFGVHHCLRTGASDTEGDKVLDFITSDIAPNYDKLYEFCKNHTEAKRGEYSYWFYIEGEVCNYAIRFLTLRGDYNLYIYQYQKEN